MKRFLFVPIILFLTSSLNAQNFQVLDQFPEVLDGTVHVVKVDTVENRVYLGGNFTRLLYSDQPSDTVMVQNFVVLDRVTGDLIDLPIAPPDSSVFDILPDGDFIYIAGRFRNIGGQAREAVAKLNRDDLSLLEWGSGLELPNANFRTIRDISKKGNRLYYAGEIAYVGDRFSGFGAINTNTGNLVNWPAANVYTSGDRSFRTILPSDTSVYIGGNFRVFGPNDGGGILQGFTDIMEIGTTGGISTNFRPTAEEGFYSTITDIIEYEGDVPELQNNLIVSGTMYVGGGEMVGKIDRDTEAFGPFGAQVATSNEFFGLGLVGSQGQDLELIGDKLYVASASFLGEFEITGEGSSSNLGSYENVFSSENWYNLAPAPMSFFIWAPIYTARSIDVKDEVLYAGGDFQEIAGEPRRRFAAIQTNVQSGCDVVEGVLSTSSPTSNLCLNNGAPNNVQAEIIGYTGSNGAYVLHDSDSNIFAAKFNGLFNMDTYPTGDYLITHVAFTQIEDTGISNLNDLEGCFALSNALSVTSFEAIPGNISTTDPLSYCIDELPDSIAFTVSGNSGPNQGVALLDGSNQLLAVSTDGVFNLLNLGVGTYKVANVSTEVTTVISEVQPPALPDCFKYSNLIIFNIEACNGAMIASNPNPVVDINNVTFTTVESENVQLELFDLTGKRIGLIYAGMAPGQTPMMFQYDTSSLPQGVYIYKLTTESEVKTTKFLKN